jgi:hypothetical protein
VRDACDDRVTTPTERASRPKWLIGQAKSDGPRAEMPAQHCAAIFLFSFIIAENYRKIKNA